MSKTDNLPDNEQLAQYLDQEIPLQQLQADKFKGLPAFMNAQLAYAKSKHSKQAEQKKKAYKKAWYTKRGGRK